jgi:hypothetical protein
LVNAWLLVGNQLSLLDLASVSVVMASAASAAAGEDAPPARTASSLRCFKSTGVGALTGEWQGFRRRPGWKRVHSVVTTPSRQTVHGAGAALGAGFHGAVYGVLRLRGMRGPSWEQTRE